VFFDGLQVFVLFHAIGVSKAMCICSFFALFSGIWTYFSWLRFGRKFESCLDLSYRIFNGPVPVIFCNKSYFAFGNIHNTLVGNSHAVGVLPQVFDHTIGTWGAWEDTPTGWPSPTAASKRLKTAK